MTHIKEWFAGMSDSGKLTTMSSKKKKLLLALFATTLLVVVAVIGIVAGVNSNKNSDDEESSSSSHAILKSSCSSTLYPELCYSTVATVPGATNNLASQKDVIEISLNLTTTAVEHNYFTVEKLYITHNSLTKREKTALHDCVETIDETLDELHKAVEDLHVYPNTKSLKQHKDDLETLLSSAMTNQGTCLDGFSHDQADKHVRGTLLSGQMLVERMCSNALAISDVAKGN